MNTDIENKASMNNIEDSIPVGTTNQKTNIENSVVENKAGLPKDNITELVQVLEITSHETITEPVVKVSDAENKKPKEITESKDKEIVLGATSSKVTDPLVVNKTEVNSSVSSSLSKHDESLIQTSTDEKTEAKIVVKPVVAAVTLTTEDIKAYVEPEPVITKEVKLPVIETFTVDNKKPAAVFVADSKSAVVVDTLAVAETKVFVEPEPVITKVEGSIVIVESKEPETVVVETKLSVVVDTVVEETKAFINSFEEGDKVEGNYRGKGNWFKGRIKKDLGDDTFDIEYDDGATETRVNIEMIRNVVSSKSAVKSKPSPETVVETKSAVVVKETKAHVEPEPIITKVDKSIVETVIVESKKNRTSYN